MASRPGKASSKLTLRVAVPKPRNPLAVPAKQRVAGPHGKSTGAVRAAERDALRRVVARRAGHDDE